MRRDWTVAIERLRAAAREATDARLAGYLVLGTDVSIQLSVWEGSGAYVAGEETALINALAGDRGMPAIRPPFPATRGLNGAPRPRRAPSSRSRERNVHRGDAVVRALALAF